MTLKVPTIRSLSLLAATFTLAGCNGSDLGGDSSSSSSSGGSTTATAQGIWSGTDSASGLTLTGIIDSTGAADFIRSDGTQYAGTAEVAGTALDMSVNVNTQFGTQFADGTISGVGTVNAAVATATSINGSLSFTTTANNTLNSTWALSFNSLYNDASSLSTIAGNYTDGSTGDPLNGASVSITSAGVMNGQSSSTGCVLNGQVTVPDSSYDAYAIAYSLENCTGSYAVLNGTSFTGLALRNGNASPAQVVIGVRGQNPAGTSYGIVSGLTLN